MLILLANKELIDSCNEQLSAFFGNYENDKMLFSLIQEMNHL
jgi:hypothetical protein